MLQVLVELEKGEKSTNAVLRLRQFRLGEGKWICAHGDYCSQRLSVFPTRLALRFANFMLYLGYDAALKK